MLSNASSQSPVLEASSRQHVQLISISQIQVPPGRQRTTSPKEDLSELEQSIRTKGLLHPITIAHSEHGPAKYDLVAGERRFRALSNIIQADGGFYFGDAELIGGVVPVVLKANLDNLARKELELEENIRRLNLSWQERVKAVSDLDALRKLQNPSHTQAETALEIMTPELTNAHAMAQKEVSQSLFVQSFLGDEDISKASTLGKAYRIALSKQETLIKSKLRVGSTPHVLLTGNAFDLFPTFPDGGFDLLITDPPYGLDSGRFNTGLVHTYQDDREYALSCIKLLASQGHRVLGRKAHIYIFCDLSLFPAILAIFTEANGGKDWIPWPTPLIWHKGDYQGHSPHPDYGPYRNYEGIFFANKGEKKIARRYSDVLTFRPEANRKHPAQKPVELIRFLIEQSADPGNKILDPFAGAGTIFPAADKARTKAVGVELDAETAKIAQGRLTDLEL